MFRALSVWKTMFFANAAHPKLTDPNPQKKHSYSQNQNHSQITIAMAKMCLQHKQTWSALFIFLFMNCGPPLKSFQ